MCILIVLENKFCSQSNTFRFMWGWDCLIIVPGNTTVSQRGPKLLPHIHCWKPITQLCENVNTLFVLCFPPSRTVFLAAVTGLGSAWSCPGDVRQQSSKWPHHFCWTHPAELLVGPKRLCRHTLCHHFCPHSATEQVWALIYFLIDAADI